MFNTVFKKLLSVYLIVILIIFTVLAVSMIKMFENYYFEKRSEALIAEGQKLNSTVIKYLNNQVTYERLEMEMESIERFLNAKIWIIDKMGYVYGVSSKSETKWIGRQLTEGDIVSVLKGNIIAKRGSYDTYFGSPVMTVGIPIFINGKVENGIFMHSPIYEIKETLKETYKIIVYSMLISMIIAVVLLYFISEKISRPIKEMNKITKIIASGEFDKRVTIMSRDEIGQLAVSFNNMAEELNKLEEMRKGFIADVSHELRTPLTLIKGYVKGLMDKEIAEEKRGEYLDIIYKETDRLTELINNLLDLSRMELGKSILNIEKFDINELIRRNIINYSNKLEEKEINVEANFKYDPILVMADKESISRVISNLVDNGIKFMNSGGSLFISTDVRENKAIISIRDTGVGIPEEDINNIWQRFYKGDKSRSRKVKGTGLGLAIVKEIIKNHNEQIWVKSRIGEGTEFTFTLKLGDKNEERRELLNN